MSLIPGKPAALLASREDHQATTHWSLYALEPGNEYAAALVTEGSVRQHHHWQWQD